MDQLTLFGLLAVTAMLVYSMRWKNEALVHPGIRRGLRLASTTASCKAHGRLEWSGDRPGVAAYRWRIRTLPETGSR